MKDLPDAVLFTCNYNRVRSPMAEGLFKRFYGTRAFVDSCGLKADPTGEGIDPFVVAVMDELGLDVSDHKPKTFAELEDDSFDVVFTQDPPALARRSSRPTAPLGRLEITRRSSDRALQALMEPPAVRSP